MSNIMKSSHCTATLPSLVILRLLGHRDRKQGLLAGALLPHEQGLVDGAHVDGMLVFRWILPFLQGWRQLDGSSSTAGYWAVTRNIEIFSQLAD